MARFRPVPRKSRGWKQVRGRQPHFLILLAGLFIAVAPCLATDPVTLSSSSVSFYSQVIGTATTKSITLTNHQTTALTGISISVSGDYSQTNTCGSQIDAGKKCTISITFSPTVKGSRPGTIVVNDNAINNPQTATLSGTGIQAAVLSAASRSYGNQVLGTTSAPQTITLTNNQKVSLSIASISTSGDYSQTNNCGSLLAATSACSINVVFSPQATGSRQGALTVTDNANNSPQTTSLSGNGVAVKLTSITVQPANVSLAQGLSQQFAATGNFNNGTTQDLSRNVAWRSSVPAVATISSAGLASGRSQGTTTLSATSGSISGSTILTVGPAQLVSIAVTPAQTSLPLGTTQQFTATGAYTDGSTSDLTTAVIWSSTTSSATVSNLAGSKGFLTTLAVGPATIAAASGNTVGTADLSVTSAALVSIAITPANFSAAQGLQQQLSATGSFSDGRQQDLTSDVTWNSSSPAVASVGNSPGTQGLVTTTSPGVTSVQAALGSIAGSTPFTVLPPLLTSMQISPLDPSIALGTTLQFVCTGAYSDGSTRDLTSSVSWNSSSPGVALAGSPPGIAGLATAQSVGVTTISVSSGALSAGTTLTVTPASLTSIAISPTAVTIPLGTPQQYAALGTFSDGSLQDVTGIVHWSTGDGTIGTISNSAPTVGLLTPVATGSVVVSAATGGVSGSAQLTVSPAALVSIIVTPQDLSLSLGATRQLAATGQYSDGSSQDLTSMASWSAGDETVAIVENAAPPRGWPRPSARARSLLQRATRGLAARPP